MFLIFRKQETKNGNVIKLVRYIKKREKWLKKQAGQNHSSTAPLKNTCISFYLNY